MNGWLQENGEKENEDDYYDDVQEVGRSDELLKSTFKVLINQVLENGGSICACTFSQLTHFIFTGVSKVCWTKIERYSYAFAFLEEHIVFLLYRHYFTPNLYQLFDFQFFHRLISVISA